MDYAAAAKMNGLGNAILIMDMRGRAWGRLEDAFVRALAQNPQTAFDQLMILQDGAETASDNNTPLYHVEIRNADGTEAQACGNGTRCLAEWLYRHERRGDKAAAHGRVYFHFATKGGLVRAERLPDGQIKVDMGRARFEPEAMPLNLAAPAASPSAPFDRLHMPLAALLPAASRAQLSPAELRLFPQEAAVLSVGNPHAVFFVQDKTADLNLYPLARFGAALEKSPVFPQGVNVSLAQITAAAAIKLRVWERGAGLTQACGTAACATQAAAHRLGLTERQAEIALPGGVLTVRMEGENCLMTGAVEYEYDGAVNLASGAFSRS